MFAVPGWSPSGELPEAVILGGARGNSRAMAATAGRNRSPINTLAASPRSLPSPPSAIAGQMRKNHRCRAATSAGLIEDGALDGVLPGGADLLAPAPGRSWKDGVRPPFSPAEGIARFIVSAPVLLTETESLAALAVLLTEGISAPEPVGDGVGFDA